jgi:hypothetical protein
MGVIVSLMWMMLGMMRMLRMMLRLGGYTDAVLRLNSHLSLLILLRRVRLDFGSRSRLSLEHLRIRLHLSFHLHQTVRLRIRLRRAPAARDHTSRRNLVKLPMMYPTRRASQVRQ